MSSLFFLFAFGCNGRIQLQDPSTGRLEPLSLDTNDAVEFNFSFGAHPGTPPTSCAFAGDKGLKILKTIGFHKPDSLPGTPACMVTGKLRIRFGQKNKIRIFEILCSELIRDLESNVYYRLSGKLTPEVCEASK